MRLAPLLAILVVGGCARTPGSGFARTPHAAELARGLDISPPSHTPYAGTSVPLTLTGDAAARPASGVMWSTQPLRRAWVTSDGVAHLFEPGLVRVIARRGDRVATTELEIRPNPVVALHAARTYGGPVFAGDSVRIAAHAIDGKGQEVDDVRPAFAIDVRGADDVRAGITADGIFTAEQPGLYTVLVEANGRAATVPILVRPSPPSVAATGAARREPAKTADDDVPARVPRLAPVIVHPAPARRVEIRSTDYTAYTGTSMRLEARVWMAGSRASDTSAAVRWSSSDTSIAIVDADGFVSFRRRGWVKLTASHGATRDTRRLLVRTNRAAHMVLQSNARFPRVGQPVRLTEEAWAYGAIRIPHARAYFGIVAQGNRPPAASISDERVFVAREPGAYTVLAVLGGRASKTTFVVYPAGQRCELGLRKWDPSCRT